MAAIKMSFELILRFKIDAQDEGIKRLHNTSKHEFCTENDKKWYNLM